MQCVGSKGSFEAGSSDLMEAWGKAMHTWLSCLPELNGTRDGCEVGQKALAGPRYVGSR